MPLNERKAKGRSLLHNGRVQLVTIERRPRLSERSLDSPEISNTSRPACLCHQIRVQLEHLAQREVPHLASLRYSSAFFESTFEAARSKSSAGRSTRSATAAAASCSGEMPNDFARSRNDSS